jgi:hypothetical protein
VEVVLICTAETGVSGFNINLMGLDGASGLISHDLALFGATEDFESNAHFGNGIKYELERRVMDFDVGYKSSYKGK